MAKIGTYLLLIGFMACGCNAQNSVTTNVIFPTQDYLFGVKSESGNLLIDSIYKQIRLVFPDEKKSLPPKEGLEGFSQPEYYLVTNVDDQSALFSSDGELVFGFLGCTSIVVDHVTQTVVVAKEIEANTRPRSFLYTLSGELVLEDSYETIAYIRHSDLIVLIAEEGANDEFYLYNPFEKKELGPFDHFNIYNQDFTTPKGISEPNFAKYKNDVNVITVRKEAGSDYRWGMIGPDGNEILPMEYSRLSLLSEADMNHPVFRGAIKPEGVDFLFRGQPIADPATSILFDSNLDKYEVKVVPGENTRIEKLK